MKDQALPLAKERALSMDEAKEKLQRLEELIPQDLSGGRLYTFGRYLAGRLNPQLVPIGFMMAWHLAISDIRIGVDSFTKKPVPNDLIAQPGIVYEMLRNELSNVADVIFPPEFAERVKFCAEQVDAERKKAAKK
jgi:hypothetical protein